MTLRPLEIDAAFIDELREDDLDTAALTAAAAIGFHFNLLNRLADAFDFVVPNATQKAKMARLLDLGGRHLGASAHPDGWIEGDDARLRPPPIATMRNDILTNEGVTDVEVRRQADRFVREQWGLFEKGTTMVPAVQRHYLGKLARHAYRIVDEDLDALRRSGLSDEAIFELTVAGAVAGASIGLEQVFGALFGEPRVLHETSQATASPA